MVDYEEMIQISKVFDRQSWKTCVTYVYISYLIQALEMPESNESLQLPLNQLRPHEILKKGVLMIINDFNVIRNISNIVTSSSNIVTRKIQVMLKVVIFNT